jgi:hypothetical protein
MASKMSKTNQVSEIYIILSYRTGQDRTGSGKRNSAAVRQTEDTQSVRFVVLQCNLILPGYYGMLD